MSLTRWILPAALSALAGPVLGQVPLSAIADIESADLARRIRAFEAINNRDEFATQRSALLLRLLVREDSAIAATVAGDRAIGEGWGEYVVALVDACLAKCDKQSFLDHILSRARPGPRPDAAAIELLAVARTKGFSRAQVQSIDSAAIAATAPGHNFMMRNAGVAGIRRALTDALPITADMRARLMDALRAATFDTLALVREAAVRALAEVADAGDLPRLEYLAANDTARSTRRGVAYYPIREAAAEGVERIRAARLRDQLQPPPPCPAWPVDTSGWRRSMGVSVGVELRHPPLAKVQKVPRGQQALKVQSDLKARPVLQVLLVQPAPPVQPAHKGRRVPARESNSLVSSLRTEQRS